MHLVRSPGLWLIVCAGLVKVTILLQLGGHPLLQPDATPDSEAYFALAQRVQAGDWWLGPGGYFVAPLYIYFLALVLAVTGSIFAAQAVQVGLGVVAVALTWWMTREWFGSRAALIAGVIAISTGLLTFYELTITQASLDTFLTASALAALTGAATRDRLWWCGVTGLLMALLILNRPNVVVAAAAVVLCLALLRQYKKVGWMVLGIVIGLAPVGIRNFSVTGALTMLPSHGGLNLYIGNAAEATGLYRNVPGVRGNILGQAVDARRVAEAATGRELSDAETSAYFSGLATSWMAEEPGAWLKLMIVKSYYVFHGQHFAVPLSYPFFAGDTGSMLQWLVCGPWLLVGLGGYGLLVRDKAISWSRFSPFLVFAPVVAFSVALFFVTERYRLPMLVPLVVGAGAALDRWITLAQQRRWVPVVRGVAVVGLAVVLLNRPLDLIDADGRREERVKMAEASARARDLPAVDHWLVRALDEYPAPEQAYLRVATILAERGEASSALLYLGRASGLPNDARDAETWLSAGRLSARLQSPETAVGLFRRAVLQEPRNTGARDQWAIGLLLVGDHAAARREFLTVVDQVPENPDAWAHLAYIAVQSGAIDEAASHARRALSYAADHALATSVLEAVKKLR